MAVSGSPLRKGAGGPSLDATSTEPVAGTKKKSTNNLIIPSAHYYLSLLFCLFRIETDKCQAKPNIMTLFIFPLLHTGEKRKLPEALTLEDAKRIRVMGDIPMELVNEVMMTITDPAAMLGPEVSSSFSLSGNRTLLTALL